MPTNTVFQITFDEPMDATTVLSQTATFLYDYGAGSYRAGTGSMSSDGLTFTFVPSGTLAVNHQHSLNMHSAFDLAGNQQNGFSLFFTTTFAGDTTPPVVSGVNPVTGSTAMPRNTRIEIRFSEAVSALSLGDARLLTNGSTSVPVTKTLSDTNQLLTLRPNGLLAANRSYTVSVSGVRDTSNNVMAAPFTSTFTTGSHTDVVVPTVTATSPVSEDRGVGLNMVARLVFSEPINPLSVSGENFRLGHATGGVYLNATIAIAADRRSVTLTPDAPLLPYTRYYVQLLGFADVAGNTGGGATIYFYTAGGLDNTAPTVLAVAPPNGSSGLPVNVRVTARMSEAIDLTSLSNGSIQLTPAAAGTVTLAADRVTLTFVPSANLAPSTAYSIRISGLRDASANTMPPTTFVFTTGASATPDTTAPTIVSRSPANGAAGIGVDIVGHLHDERAHHGGGCWASLRARLRRRLGRGDHPACRRLHGRRNRHRDHLHGDGSLPGKRNDSVVHEQQQLDPGHGRVAAAEPVCAVHHGEHTGCHRTNRSDGHANERRRRTSVSMPSSR